jgi:hypothetical protein
MMFGGRHKGENLPESGKDCQILIGAISDGLS